MHLNKPLPVKGLFFSPVPSPSLRPSFQEIYPLDHKLVLLINAPDKISRFHWIGRYSFRSNRRHTGGVKADEKHLNLFPQTGRGYPLSPSLWGLLTSLTTAPSVRDLLKDRISV